MTRRRKLTEFGVARVDGRKLETLASIEQLHMSSHRLNGLVADKPLDMRSSSGSLHDLQVPEYSQWFATRWTPQSCWTAKGHIDDSTHLCGVDVRRGCKWMVMIYLLDDDVKHTATIRTQHYARHTQQDAEWTEINIHTR